MCPLVRRAAPFEWFAVRMCAILIVSRLVRGAKSFVTRGRFAMEKSDPGCVSRVPANALSTAQRMGLPARGVPSHLQISTTAFHRAHRLGVFAPGRRRLARAPWLAIVAEQADDEFESSNFFPDALDCHLFLSQNFVKIIHNNLRGR